MKDFRDSAMRVESPQSTERRRDVVDVAANLRTVQERIEEAARESRRRASDTNLIAVSKAHGAERITPALDAGHRVFGENRAQEAEAKWPPLREAFPSVELHLIGPLQTNKAKAAVAAFDVIQTVDRPKLARVLSEEMSRAGRQRDCFVQVNVGEESQKAGAPPMEADRFIAECRERYRLRVRGVMCIPPFDQEPSPYFALSAKIAERNGLPWVSMGMSGDYEIAIAFGATHVRIGAAIFGPRDSR